MSERDYKELFRILENIFKEKKEEFVPGKTTIHYALAVYDHREIFAVWMVWDRKICQRI